MKAKQLIVILSIFILFGHSSYLPKSQISVEENNLYLKAVVGDADSQFQLANKYNSELGILRKPGLAKKWYRAAALNDHIESQNKLGLLYIELKNYLEARVWFESAVNAGHIDAHANLAEMYETGKGMFINISKAHSLYYKAAVLGHIKSMFKVGAHFTSGTAVKQDVYAGCVWVYRASNSIENLYDSGLEKNIKNLKHTCDHELSDSSKLNALQEAKINVDSREVKYKNLMTLTY